MKLCKVCGAEAKAVFNIKLKAVPICESCANDIAWQQIESLIRENNARISYETLTKGLP